MKEIQRISKAKLHSYKKLTQKKYREEEGKFIVEGEHVVEEAIVSDWFVDSLFVTEEYLQKDSAQRLIFTAQRKKIELFLLAEQELGQLSDSVTSQGVAAIISQKKIQLDTSITKQKESLIVVLDQINDPGNLGTIIRTCDWFGVDCLIVSSNSVELFSPKVVRSTMGSIFHFPAITDVDVKDTLRQLKQENYTVILATIDAPSKLHDVRFPKKTVLVFGNEAHGISKELQNCADESVSIKKYGKAESLNVAMACGVFLSYIRK
ncbi:MAG: RNA methyltransferase [Ignavibacteriae bacterium]|nr:RNA methyltransferase [Ignavibacteriota bacterium]